MRPLKVFLPHGSSYLLTLMWRDGGDEIVDSLEDADVVQFSRPTDKDLCAKLYGEYSHSQTKGCSFLDTRDILLFQVAQKAGKYCAGVGGGAQFLNVMAGGGLYQHANGHLLTNSTHPAVDTIEGDEHLVTSQHHQTMKPHEDGIILLVSAESTMRCFLKSEKHIVLERRAHDNKKWEPDVEAVYYPKMKSLCFQPHPEFIRQPETTDLYRRYINDYLCMSLDRK